MRQTFSPFGPIMEIRVFPDKGYSFVRCVEVFGCWLSCTRRHARAFTGWVSMSLAALSCVFLQV